MSRKQQQRVWFVEGRNMTEEQVLATTTSGSDERRYKLQGVEAAA